MRMSFSNYGSLLVVPLACLALASLSCTVDTAEAQEAAPEVTVARWEWLKDTTWVVPPNGTPGYTLLNAETIVKVTDQTVYQVTDYRDGYF